MKTHAPTLEQLQQGQRLETLGTLAGGIAHDLNNYLTVVLNNVALGIESSEPGSAAFLGLMDAQRAAQRCTEMTRGLLSFSRCAPVHLKPLRMDALLEETGRLLRRLLPASIAVVVDAEPNLRSILGDPTQLQQVLMNLAVNARDAMPDGGTLTIRACNGPYRLLIEVSDTGSGIPAEIRERIFEPFFTSKLGAGGTGLGLAYAFGIVRNHDGWMHVDSEAGQGSTFHVSIPFCDENPSSETSHPAAESMTGACLLVAEDEELARRAAATVLRLRGCQVLEACDGEEAVQLFFEHAREIDLLILNVTMPKCSGPLALARIRQLRPGVRALLTSGHTVESSEPVLQKPFTSIELVRKVRELLYGTV